MDPDPHEIVQRAKTLLEHQPIEAFQTYLTDVFEMLADEDIDWSFVFQKIYLHACLKLRHAVATWMETVAFQHLPPIQQIAIRQVFSYGRTLLARGSGINA